MTNVLLPKERPRVPTADGPCFYLSPLVSSAAVMEEFAWSHTAKMSLRIDRQGIGSGLYFRRNGAFGRFVRIW